LDFITRKEISSTLIEELMQKYTQYIVSKNWSNEKLTQLKKSMQKIIQYIEDFETRFKIASKLISLSLEINIRINLKLFNLKNQIFIDI
jgi:polysaccharide deacetylase 2 family uncharacterized protein YibQ